MTADTGFIQFQPIPKIPALYLPKRKMLVLADLHIGIENELREYGVHISSQIQSMKQILIDICNSYEIKDIMILGDVKHTIPSTPFHEKRELYRFLDELHTYGIIHIVPGNHDGGIRDLIPDHIRIHSSAGVIIKDIGFIHGHRWPRDDIMKAAFVIMGHTHPTIMLKDRLGFKTYEPCWLKCHIKKKELKEKYRDANDTLSVLVLPAFNPLCGGLAVNEDGVMGPLSNILDIQHADIFLLEGTNLGVVKAHQP